jgi:hypothetical protein
MIAPDLIPKDPRHQRFADRQLAGDSLSDAYLGAGYKCSPAAAKAAGMRMSKRKDVRAYIRAIQGEAAKGAVASVQYKREFLFLIMDTPLMDIDPEDTGRKHGKLIKKYESSEFGYKMEKYCALKAIEIDNKLSGDDPETNALADLAAAIQSLAPAGVLPTGKM